MHNTIEKDISQLYAASPMSLKLYEDFKSDAHATDGEVRISGRSIALWSSKIDAVHLLLSESLYHRLKKENFQPHEAVYIHNENEKNSYAGAITFDHLTYDEKKGCWFGSSNDQKNLEEGIIEFAGDVKSFTIDDLLVLCSLTSMLDLPLSAKSYHLCMDYAEVKDAKNLPVEFLRNIFINIMIGAKPSRAFLFMDTISLLEWFLPELYRAKGVTQNRFHKYDVYHHSLYAADAVDEPDLILRTAALFHDLGKVETRMEKFDGEATFHNHEMISTRHTDRILKRFAFDRAVIKQIKFLVRHHMFHYTSDWSDRAIRRFLSRVGVDHLEELIRLRLADRKGSGKRSELPVAIKKMMLHIQEVRNREAEFKVTDLVIGGADLIRAGVAPGPIMGVLLRELTEEVKQGRLANEVEPLMTHLKIIMQKHNINL